MIATLLFTSTAFAAGCLLLIAHADRLQNASFEPWILAYPYYDPSHRYHGSQVIFYLASSARWNTPVIPA